VVVCKLVAAWFRRLPFEECPACGAPARNHDIRTLACERFSPGISGIESHLARRDFASAAALDEPDTWGDRLVHYLVRCGHRAIIVTVADPFGVGLEPHIRGSIHLEGADADAAWSCAR